MAVGVGTLESPGRDALRVGYDAQLRQAALESTLVLGIVALVAFPAWSGFDLLLPHQAERFLAVRLVFEMGIALAWLALRWDRIGGRWPQQVAFALIVLPEIAIAWMLPRSTPHLEAYLLGFSLAICGSAFLLVWRRELTALLLSVAVLATAGFTAFTHPVLDVAQLATMGFYLVTTGALVTAAQIYRDRAGMQRFTIQTELDHEHSRNQALLAELVRLSQEDSLTGLANRRAWEQRLTEETARAARFGTQLAIIYCDFDHLKRVNDGHGHAVGDQVLRAGAALMAGRLRVTGYLARLGGDEFAVACPGTTLEGAADLARDLVEHARAAPWPNGVAMTFSMGIAALTPNDHDSEALSHRADTALYSAKLARDSVCTEPATGRPERQLDRPAPGAPFDAGPVPQRAAAADRISFDGSVLDVPGPMSRGAPHPGPGVDRPSAGRLRSAGHIIVCYPGHGDDAGDPEHEASSRGLWAGARTGPDGRPG
jgi:diguanylate cyclase (GGDEF)-like protein